MSNPSWLPTWPSPPPPQDYETAYRNMVPRQFPQNLYNEEGNAYQDQQAHGEVLSWVRKATWWVLEYIWPWKDTLLLFLDRWEDTFGIEFGGIEISGTQQTRQNRIISSMRNRGTVTLDMIKAVFIWVFGTDDPDDVSTAASTPTQTWGANLHWKKIYCPDLTVDFNDISGYGSDIYSGTTPNTTFIVGDSGEIYKRNTATTLQASSSGTANDLHGVWVYDIDFGVTVGASSTIREWNGSTWVAGPAGLPASETFYGVFGLSDTDYWVCGSNRYICHYDGTSWTNQQVGLAGDTWSDIHVIQEGHIWACASSGRVARSTDNGTTWTTWAVVGTVLDGIRAMRGDYLGHAWVVGASGVIRHYDTSIWQNEDQGTITFRGLDGWAYNRLVAVGNDGATEGVCYRRKESSWVSVATNSWETLNSVWCDIRSCYTGICGENGRTLHSPPNDEGFMRSQNHLHIYSTNLDLDPDRGLADDKLVLLQSAVQKWSCGRRLTLRASDTESGANNACAE